ncbi:MAG: hypothetical protein ABI321_13835 [Polyangia bacterium]
MTLRTLILAASVVPLVACTHTFTYTKLNDPPHALTPRRLEDVEVFKVEPPGRENVEIGMLETKRPVFDRDAEISPTMIERFRKKAGEFGCEFIVLDSMKPVNASATRSDRFRAACVVYR